MRLRRLLWIAAALPAAVLAYGAAGYGLGAWPTADPPPSGPLRLAVIANPFHADLVLPATGAGIDWRARLGLPDEAVYVSLGWGDRRFYTETPHLSDLKAGTVLLALTGTDDAVIHVDWYRGFPRGEEVHPFPATEAQAKSLAAYVDRALADGPIVLPGLSFFGTDAFFKAKGHWSPLLTCNEWLGRAFREAHVRTGLWTPFSAGLTPHLDGI